MTTKHGASVIAAAISAGWSNAGRLAWKRGHAKLAGMRTTAMNADQKVVMPFCGEEVEDLLFMLSQDPAWHDRSKITIRVGRVELERLLATALNAS